MANGTFVNGVYLQPTGNLTISDINSFSPAGLQRLIEKGQIIVGTPPENVTGYTSPETLPSFVSDAGIESLPTAPNSIVVTDAVRENPAVTINPDTGAASIYDPNNPSASKEELYVTSDTSGNIYTGTLEGGDTNMEETTATTTTADTPEANTNTYTAGATGAIVPGAPEFGEVNIMDFLGLMASDPRLADNTEIQSKLKEIGITEEQLAQYKDAYKLETGTDYIAEPDDITAKTVGSVTAKDAVTAVAETTDLVDQPDVAKTTAEKSLEQIKEEADALQAAKLELSDIDPRATVQGQLAGLMKQFEGGETPVWAQGAMRTATALMAQRGLGASSIAAEAITNALMQSTLDIAVQDASFYQTVTLENLSNEQQAEMEKFNSRVSAIFNDQAAQNTANNLNMQEDNAMIRFFTDLSQQVALQNTKETNAMEQFNATAKNQMTQFFEELGLTAETFNADALNDMAQFNAEQLSIVNQFNADMENQRQQYNINNQLEIDAFNINWRRDVNTANTSAENAAMQVDAQNLLDIQMTALNNIWQHFDTVLNYAFQAEESDKDRAFQIALTELSSQLKAKLQEDSDLMDLFGIGIESGVKLLASESGSKWLNIG